MWFPELEHFDPGTIGGVTDWTLAPNKLRTGATNVGEFWLSGTYYQHPNGTRYSVATINDIGTTEMSIATPFGDTVSLRSGIGFLMFSVEPLEDRFPTFDPDGTDSLNICSVAYRQGAWVALDNANTEFTFEPLATDVLLARFEGGQSGQGITSLQLLTTNDSGITNAEATSVANNYVVCERTGYRVKPGELRDQWDGAKVRPESFDRRHPQEFMRGRPETFKPSPSPQLPDVHVEDLYPNGVTLDDLDP
jgi:hypothetical protein